MKQIVVVLLLFCCAQAQQYRVEYVLITDTCCGNTRPDNIGVEYRDSAGSETWKSLQNSRNIERSDTQLCNKTAISSERTYTLYTRQGRFPDEYKVGDGEGIELRFIQINHHGGYCDCWGLACDILLLNSSGQVVNTIKKQQISCSDSESSGSGYFEKQSEEAGGSSGGTSDDNIILYGSSNSIASGSDSISIDDISGGSGAELADLLHDASAEDSSSMIESSTYSNYSGSDSVELLTASGSGLPTLNETSGLGSSLGGCPLDTIQSEIECLPSRVCGGSASVERGFITGFTHPDEPSCAPDSSIVITEQKEHDIRMNDECDVTKPYLEIMFAYIFRSLDSFDEGLELSFQNNMNGRGSWIPLRFFSASQHRTVHEIDLGDISDEGLLRLRGYPVNITASENYSEASIKLCGPSVFNDQSAKGLFNWRFRWLQTVANDPMDGIDEDDAIYIYNVSITVNDTQQLQLFQDQFSTGEELSSEKWSVQRNVEQQQNCGELNDSCLEFSSSTGSENLPDCAEPITSREASTVCLNSITQIQYTLITASSADCPNNINGNLTSKFQFPQLQYQWRSSDWVNIGLDPGDPATSVVNASNSDITRYDMIVDLRDQISRLDRCSFNHLRFRFIQREHRGGFCDCWAVANLTATLTSGEVKDLRKSCSSSTQTDLLFFEDDPLAQWGAATGFCQDSASVIRVFQTQSGSDIARGDHSNNMEICNIKATSPYTVNYCDDLKIEVAFDVMLGFSESSNCDEVEDFSEGVELSVRRDQGKWIPLMFFASTSIMEEPFINLPKDSTKSTITLRGYTVPYNILAENASNSISVDICQRDVNIFTGRLQFRWLQSSYQRSKSVRDVVILEDITVRAANCSNNVTLLSSVNASQLNTSLTYNVHSQPPPNSSCANSSSEALYFYQRSVNYIGSFNNESYTITSRQAVTEEIKLDEFESLPSRCQPSGPREIPSTTETVSSTIGRITNSEEVISIKPTTTSFQESTEIFSTTQNLIMTDFSQISSLTLGGPTLSVTFSDSSINSLRMDTSSDSAILSNPFITKSLSTDGTMDVVRTVTTSPQGTIELPATITRISGMILHTLPISPTPSPTPLTNNEEILERNIDRVLESLSIRVDDLFITTYNLSFALRGAGNQTVELEISELILNVSGALLDIAQNNFEAENVSLEDFVAGSTLLQLLENFALNNHDASYPRVTSNNIILRVKEVSINTTNERISSQFEGENARISIPREVIASVEGRESILIASILYRNMSGLLPESLEGVQRNNNDSLILRLASPVISISPQCDGINCTTSNLSTPVEATFTHTPYDMALLEDDGLEGNMTCVFWKFADDQQPESLLFPGQWSTDGCETNSSTPESTICHCNHLTNFAILLSARPIELPSPQALALRITGYIGVSVSLVAMAATILVFIFLKPLRTMRNYIHIQLCVTLGIAQIIFVAGVEPRLGEGGGVPIGCRSVAVLLHYWFLVSFMWMLMEGVVLYVALVRVFVKHYARYVAAFTITSYGLPLLYMGVLTLPLGFARTDHYRKYHPYDYGYEQACYLSPHTSFVWSLLAPVILIFLANIGFFIMAIVIMYRHQKRQRTDKKAHKVKHWLKASISLTVVMGITWIIGFLVIEVEELFTLAYIFTIFVAFQGVFIFIIFVLLSKQVKENYAKWWKAKVAESDFLSKHFGDKTLGTSLSAQTKTPTPSYDKSNQKLSSTAMASKDYLEQSRADDLESSYNSQNKLSPVPLNSCDNESHRSFTIGDGAAPLIGPIENGFTFNITYIPCSEVPMDSTAILSDNNSFTDTKSQDSERSSSKMEEVELSTKWATPNDYILTNSFIYDQLTEDERSTKL